MKDATEIEQINRLKLAAGVTLDQDLAQKFGISKQAIADARSRKRVPLPWIPKAAELFGVSTDWLFFGRGPMRPGEEQPVITPQSKQLAQLSENTSTMHCPRCEKLEARLEKTEGKLERVESQRDELVDENRRLLKENGTLRERLARLEEREDNKDNGGLSAKAS